MEAIIAGTADCRSRAPKLRVMAAPRLSGICGAGVVAGVTMGLLLLWWQIPRHHDQMGAVGWLAATYPSRDDGGIMTGRAGRPTVSTGLIGAAPKADGTLDALPGSVGGQWTWCTHMMKYGINFNGGWPPQLVQELPDRRACGQG